MSNDTPNTPISFRPPKDKRAKIDAMKAESGLSYSAFITDCILNRSRHRPAELKRLAQILSHCAALSDKLNDVEFNGAAHSALVIEEIRNELRLIRTALMRLMGRRS